MPHYEQYTPVEALQIVEKNKAEMAAFLNKAGAKVCNDCGGACIIDREGDRWSVTETSYIILANGKLSVCAKDIFESIFLEVTGANQ